MLLANWLNEKTKDDGFTALHFASFRGNLKIVKLLVEYGADIYIKNNHGINMMHVAAQGDQPVTLYYFREKGIDLHSRDYRQSTPMHWACYSKCEIALSYLLAWVEDIDVKDGEGLTPLHLAVKKSEELRSTRPVRALLIRGADRDQRDKHNRRPIDLVEDISDEQLAAELRHILAVPNYLACLLLKTPLTVVKKSHNT